VHRQESDRGAVEIARDAKLDPSMNVLLESPSKGLFSNHPPAPSPPLQRQRLGCPSEDVIPPFAVAGLAAGGQASRPLLGAVTRARIRTRKQRRDVACAVGTSVRSGGILQCYHSRGQGPAVLCRLFRAVGASRANLLWREAPCPALPQSPVGQQLLRLSPPHPRLDSSSP
jgi:hypothetical protein